MDNTTNPLSGLTPVDGELVFLTPEELYAVSFTIGDAYSQFDFNEEWGVDILSGRELLFWATLPENEDSPSITIDGVSWDIYMARDEESAPWVWSPKSEIWEDTSRY